MKKQVKSSSLTRKSSEESTGTTRRASAGIAEGDLVNVELEFWSPLKQRWVQARGDFRVRRTDAS